jgi:hypothetical protein
LSLDFNNPAKIRNSFHIVIAGRVFRTVPPAIFRFAGRRRTDCPQ